MRGDLGTCDSSRLCRRTHSLDMVCVSWRLLKDSASSSFLDRLLHRDLLPLSSCLLRGSRGWAKKTLPIEFSAPERLFSHLSAQLYVISLLLRSSPNRISGWLGHVSFLSFPFLCLIFQCEPWDSLFFSLYLRFCPFIFLFFFPYCAFRLFSLPFVFLPSFLPFFPIYIFLKPFWYTLHLIPNIFFLFFSFLFSSHHPSPSITFSSQFCLRHVHLSLVLVILCLVFLLSLSLLLIEVKIV